MAPTLRRLVGVYDADHTIRGELAYVVGQRLGRAHCALCDITHGRWRASPDWKACQAGLPVPFDTFHRDDQPDDVRVAVAGAVPVVVADTDQGWVLVVDAAGLEACHGSADALVSAIERGIERAGLAYPDPGAAAAEPSIADPPR